tara:strand:+ start:26 stop:283 length:258 start_codon:yes stop_codon:yes gene_type:complete
MWDDIDLDPNFLDNIETSAQETNNIDAEDFDDYNEFVAAKIKTIPSPIIALMTNAPEDSQILYGIQSIWLKEFWSTRKIAKSMKN